MAEKEREERRDAVQAETVTKEGGLLDRIISEGRLARDDTQKEYAKDLIGEFVKQVMLTSKSWKHRGEASITWSIRVRPETC
jgi:type VI secretion system protein ImpC